MGEYHPPGNISKLLMAEQKRKKSKWLLWVSIASAVIFLISPVVLYRMKQCAAFNRTLRELSEAGYPTTNEELQAMHVLPEGVENAADIYQKAFAVYHEPNEADKQWLPFQGDYEVKDAEPYPPEVLDAIARSLEQNAECLALLDQAAQIDHCLFPIEFDGYATRLEHLSPLEDCMNLMAERNLLMVYSGLPDNVFYSLQANLGVSKNTSGKIVFLMEYYYNRRIKLMVLDDLEIALKNVTFTEDQLSSLQKRLSQSMLPNQLSVIYSGEVVLCVDLRDRPPLTVLNDLSYYFDPLEEFYCGAMLFINDVTGRMDKDYAFALDTYKRGIEISNLPSYQQLAEIDHLNKRAGSYKYCSLITELFSIKFCEYELHLHTISSLRCAETAMAVERYRLKYGQLPQSLEALVPEFIDAVRLDPFDGAPIRYNILETGGYSLYTVGEDGVDNGGIDQDHKPAGSDEYDYPFTVGRNDKSVERK